MLGRNRTLHSKKRKRKWKSKRDLGPRPGICWHVARSRIISRGNEYCKAVVSHNRWKDCDPLELMQTPTIHRQPSTTTIPCQPPLGARTVLSRGKWEDGVADVRDEADGAAAAPTVRDGGALWEAKKAWMTTMWGEDNCGAANWSGKRGRWREIGIRIGKIGKEDRRVETCHDSK